MNQDLYVKLRSTMETAMDALSDGVLALNNHYSEACGALPIGEVVDIEEPAGKRTRRLTLRIEGRTVLIDGRILYSASSDLTGRDDSKRHLIRTFSGDRIIAKHPQSQ